MRRGGAPTAAVAACCVALSPGIAGAGTNDTIDELGHWSLPEMGAHAFDLPTDAPRSARRVRFVLPSDVSQGKPAWYLVRLRFEIEFDQQTGPGLVYVGASTNGRAAEMVKFKVRRDADDPRARIQWSTLDLIRGARHGTVQRREIIRDEKNYLQDRGVRPGMNVLRFEVEQLGDVKVRRIRVLEASGITVSDKRPPHLRLTTLLPDEPVVRGKVFAIGYRVRNDGDIAARKVGASMDSLSPHLRVLSHHGSRIRALRPGGEISGWFRLKATRTGAFRLSVMAGGENTNYPREEIAGSAGLGRASDDSEDSFFAAFAGHADTPHRGLALALVLALIATGLALRPRAAGPPGQRRRWYPVSRGRSR
jgi:hypothetical protein